MLPAAIGLRDTGEKMLGLVFDVGVFGFVLWIAGTYDKYPEIAVPLFLLYFSYVAGGYFRNARFQNKWKELRKKLVKTDDSEEAAKIEEDMERLENYNTPLTVGHLYRFKAEFEDKWDRMVNRLYAIERRLQKDDDDVDSKF